MSPARSLDLSYGLSVTASSMRSAAVALLRSAGTARHEMGGRRHGQLTDYSWRGRGDEEAI